MKKIVGQAFKFIYFFSCFFALFTNYAHAYIDPSAVTYVIQAVAGVLIALGSYEDLRQRALKSYYKQQEERGCTGRYH